MYNNPNIIIINTHKQVIKENNPKDKDQIDKRLNNTFYDKISGYTNKCYSKSTITIKF